MMEKLYPINTEQFTEHLKIYGDYPQKIIPRYSLDILRVLKILLQVLISGLFLTIMK